MTKQTSSPPPPALHATKSSCSSTTSISCFHLKGHLDSVLCLDYDNDTNHLLSGSEDKTARLWDLRTSTTVNNFNKPLRASLCIQCPGEVNSVVFGPLHDRESTAASASASSSLFGRDCSVFLAVENSVYGYDLRYATSPVIQWNDTSKSSSSSSSTGVPLSSTDEINQVVFSQQKRKQSTQQPPPPPQNQQQHQQQAPLFLLAAADDAGEIRVTNHYWMNQQQTTVLKETGEPDATPHLTILQHSAPGAMIMACAFRPNHPSQPSHHHAKRNKKHNKKKQQHRQQPQDELLSQQSQSPVCTELLATGGTDCAVQLWDVSSNPHQQQQHPQQSQKHQKHQPPIQRRRPLEQHTMKPVQSGASQICNPPMVHSLDWSPSGRILAAGLGDGSVSLFTVPNHKSLVQVARLEDAHGGAVASVHFPCTPTAAAAASPDRLLLTAGNDGVVVIWDLGATLCEPQQPQQQDHNNNNNHHHNKDSHHHGDKHDKPNDDVDDDDALSHWVSLLQLGESETNEKSNKNDKNDDDNKNNDKGDDYDFDCDQPKTLFGIQHGIKPNWMITNYNSNPCIIFVADTSNDITAYTIPS